MEGGRGGDQGRHKKGTGVRERGDSAKYWLKDREANSAAWPSQFSSLRDSGEPVTKGWLIRARDDLEGGTIAPTRKTAGGGPGKNSSGEINFSKGRIEKEERKRGRIVNGTI